MNDATPDTPAPETRATPQSVAAAKAAWRRHAAALTWEEKIAAIERMRERDATIRQVREAADVPVRTGQS